MEKELERIKKNAIIEITTWAGLSLTPGVDGTIITKDYNLYYYHNYHHIAPSLQDKIKPNYLSKPIKLNDKTINKINNFIEEKILNKTYEYQLIMDVSFHLTIKYNNKTINIENYPELNHELNKIIERGIKNEKEQ